MIPIAILIGGTHSGCGKTTITCAILQSLVNRGLKTASFKCGPDYIDPMFHSRVVGTDSYNLDGYFCDENTLRYLFSTHSENKDISVIEGVMGYYDGESGSAHSLSAALNVPSVIVVDCKGAGESIGAVIKGFLTYKTPNTIRGFIFNRLSEKIAPRIRAICGELGTEFLGYLPPVRDCVIESRHLGLVTASEIPDLRKKLAALADYAEKYIDINRLVSLGKPDSATPLSGTAPALPRLSFDKPPVIAVAKDAAFCFIYRDNLELLERLGCEIRCFSPISDNTLPDETSGLILCGGYPELYARKLSENTSMRDSIRTAIAAGMPTIAECGGFLYLHRSLETAAGEKYPMVGTIAADAFRTDKLQRFGYIELTANRPNLLCGKGETFRSHEFHYWDSTDCGDCFTAVKPNGTKWKCGIASDTLYAGFPHLYFYANPKIAVNFVQKCVEFKHYGENNG